MAQEPAMSSKSKYLDSTIKKGTQTNKKIRNNTYLIDVGWLIGQEGVAGGGTT
jgi:hypothetical protein